MLLLTLGLAFHATQFSHTGRCPANLNKHPKLMTNFFVHGDTLSDSHLKCYSLLSVLAAR